MLDSTHDQGITKDTSFTHIRLRLCLWCIVLCGFLVTLFVMTALAAALIDVYKAQRFSVPGKITKPAPSVTTEESILEGIPDDEWIENFLKRRELSRKEEPPSGDPYLKITIREEKTDEGVAFSLLNIENLYGSFEGHIPTRYTGNAFCKHYLLTVYDKEDTAIDQYCVYSSRFLNWDDFSDPDNPRGGQIEHASGTLYITIPNEANIHRIGIQDFMKGRERKENESPEIDLGPVIREK